MPRILMVLRALNWAEAKACLDSARSAASDPGSLTVGLSLSHEPEEDELEEMHKLGASLYLVPGSDPWEDMELLWRGESHVLAAHPAMRFSAGWDRELFRALSWCRRSSGFNTLLTGYLPGSVEPVDAVCAVAAKQIDRRLRLHYHRGTPLRYAVHPVPGAFIDPDFCFAPAVFFRSMQQEKLPLFLAACKCRWEIYTFNKPVIHMAWESSHEPEELRELTGTEALVRFETRHRFTVQDRQLPPRLVCGILTQDMSFETKVPRMVRMQEALRKLDSLTSRLNPTCVTAWLTLPGIKLDDRRMLCFRRLSGMQNLPLVCYTDPPNAARISLSYDRVMEYKQYYGLQVPSAVMRQSLHDYMMLCKPFMLARTRQNELSSSHYIWIDFDYLRYPAYEKSALDWQTVCHDRIVMASVNDRPDPTMFVVPEERLEPLCREINAIVQHELTLGKTLPEETTLWERLLADHPDWFEMIALPNRRELLALTMTGRGEEYHTT